MNEKNKKKIIVNLICVIAVVALIGGIQIIVNMANKSSERYGEKAGIEDVRGITTNSSTTNKNNNTSYNSKIISKWNATLPLNNTNGLKCAVYSINKETLYLEYNFGICVVDKNDEINRYMDGDTEYLTAQINIANGKNGVSGYIYMTSNEFESIIK